MRDVGRLVIVERSVPGVDRFNKCRLQGLKSALKRQPFPNERLVTLVERDQGLGVVKDSTCRQVGQAGHDCCG